LIGIDQGSPKTLFLRFLDQKCKVKFSKTIIL